MMAYMNQAKRDDWTTPTELFEDLDAVFGPFDLDAAATDENALCENYYTQETDGLAQEWFGQVFVNPPYGRVISKWVDKAIQEWDEKRPTGVVMLLPSRTGTRWFHRLNDHPDVEIVFLRGRLKFGGSSTSAPFDSMVVVFE